ncbi:MAG: hypothetical protein OQL05_03315 [Gammaproteobacteria bacterium]|nr:hypothetical protein [Gammaproteobacteria bacterium]MCW8972290.1 hypothetical protein [Gammaproteobacteria bacterium]MCW8993744.1 hypothetical protein [Gammaproteobacteria bacterium]
MAAPDTDVQLKVWKELAISKQVLMNAATAALKLDKECSQEELKQALETTISRAAEAEAEINKIQEQASLDIVAVEKKLAESQKALSEVEASLAEAQENQQKLEQKLTNERANNERQQKKLKESLAEKERAIKAITTTLSDKPENVVKKLKTLKKQKMDESDARKKAEQALSVLRKEKQQLEQELKAVQTAEDKPEEVKAA